jgi:hypothetical protein
MPRWNKNEETPELQSRLREIMLPIKEELLRARTRIDSGTTPDGMLPEQVKDEFDLRQVSLGPGYNVWN